MATKSTHQQAFTKYLTDIHAKARKEFDSIKGKTKKTYMEVLHEIQKKNPFKK